MSDTPYSKNPFMDSWFQAAGKMMEAQDPFWSAFASQTDGEDSEAVRESRNVWDEARKHAHDWMAAFAMPQGGAETDDGVARNVLAKMLDPEQFVYAGSDQINETIQKLVEGPEFSDIGTLERQGLRATQEWLALQEASARYRAVTTRAWAQAFDKFRGEGAGRAAEWSRDPGRAMKAWLEISNDVLIDTQRTEDFLAAQRDLLRAGVDYRIRVSTMTESWCASHSVPTRTEVDDLIAIVYDLRKRVRALERGGAQPAARRAPRQQSQ